MKKILRRLLLLTLWMVLCLVPLTANAEGENPIELTQDNYKSYLKDSGKYDKFYLPSGSYILMGDITLDETLLIGYDEQFNDKDFTDVNVTLDLNGYVLRQGNVDPYPVIQVYQGSNLTIQDSRPEVTHKFTADSTGLWKLDEANGDKTVNGGVITGSVKTGMVLQAVDMNKDTYVARCTMNGGNIVGCTYSSFGGGVYVGDKAEFTMKGGSIRGCTVTDPQHGFGGGVYVVSGTFTMNGGTISDCVSATTDGGDALFMAGYDAENSSFSMSAEATINGSFKDANPGASEGSLGVYTVTFDSDNGSQVTSQVRPQGAAAVKPADPTKDGWDFGGWYIGETAYDFTQPVTANLTLTAKWTQHRHCVCGGDTNIGDHTQHTTDELWTAWTATDSLPTAAGNYYLVNDVDIAADITNDWCVKDVKLCLNGKKVTMNGAVISVYMDTFFSLTDCAGGGRIIGGSDAASGGSDVVRLLGSAEFNLFGGSVSNISPANRENSIVRFLWAPDAGTFNMYGGILGAPDGAAGGDSDGVYVRFLDNTYRGNIFNAYGGRVRGVISKTVEQGVYDEVGTINFGDTVFESKVYLSKGSTDIPKLNGDDGKIVYFYPGRIFNGTECVRIDEQNKADVFGDGKVSFEWDENGGSGKLILKDSELSGIKTKFDLEIVLLGNNKIMATNESIFTAPNKLTFSGTGRLAIENDRNSIVCNEMLVKSGDISISIQRGLALANVTKLTVNGGTLELATASAGSEFGVLYTAYGGNVDPDKVIDITLGADRRMVTGTNSDCVDAVITETTEKEAIGAAKYVYIGEKHDHCLCGGNTDVGDHTSHSDLTWIPWTAKDKLPETAGNYYLVNDVDIPESNSEWKTAGMNLCLNGKKVTTNGVTITIGYNYNGDDCFSLTDCAGGGKIIGGASTAGGGSCVVRLEMNETFNLFGGSISSVSPKNEDNSIVCYDNSLNCAFNMYGGTLGDPDGAAGEDSDGIYVRFCGTSNHGNIFNAYGGSVRGVISKTVDHVSYDEIGTINFGGTVFESKVYLSKGSTNIPEENELNGNGEIVYFYPSRLYNGTEWVRIDEQNKDDILGDGGKVKFEYMESAGSGRLTLKDAELVDNGHSVSILAGLDLEIVLSGDNKITGYSGIETTHKLIFSGTGKLTIKISNYSLGIRCDEMIVNSGDISISTEKYKTIYAASGKLTVNGGTLKLAVANTDPTYGVLYTKIGKDIDVDKVINITLGADRSMLAGKNSDGTDAVIIEPTDKNAVGNAKYIYIGEKHDHCLCGGTTYDGHDSHTDISWMPWMAADKLPDKAGNYFLMNDVTLSAGTPALPDGVNLCLNGKAVRGAGAGYTKLSINGAMTVTDCGKAGSFGNLTISDGAFTMTGSAGNEGVLQIEGETDFTMTGNAQNNSRIILNETSDVAKIVFGGSCGGIGTVSVSSPQYAAGIRVEGSAKLAALEGETLDTYIRLTLQEKADVTVDNLGFRALSMSGESTIHGKITGADASSTFIMQDSARIDGDINVGDSKVDGKVVCTGNIISGTFNDDVVCSGEIQGGIFNGNVENNGKITGGIFYGTVRGTGTIEDSAKVAVNFDSDGGSAVDTQKILRGQKAVAPAAPAKISYLFDSWTDGGTAFDFATPIIKETTLTATWTLCDHSASTAHPTCTEQATCTVCKGKYGNVLDHSYGAPVYIWNGMSCTAERVCGRDASHKETETVTAAVTVTQNRTCTLDELSAYTATFTNGAFAVQTQENIKTADRLGHSYGEPAYTWNGTKCTAERVCGRDASHKETETVTAAVTVTQNRTCTLDELSTYTATFTNAVFAVQTKENVKTADKLDHSYGEPVYAWNGTSCTAERVCGRDASHKETETVTAAVTVTQNRTCTLDELSAYTATFANAAFAVQTKENIKTADKLGHSYGEPVCTWNGTKCTAERVCKRDASHKENETVTATVTVTQQPTCTLDELSTYTATFTNAAFAVQKRENVKTADELGHNFKVQQCNETQHWNKCSRCDEIDAKENHTGGTAACNVKAECVVCHAKYGEIDGNNHSGLEEVLRIPATAADTGTMEHWHCNACGKLFADAAGKIEISSFDTILWKIAPTIIEGMNGKWNKGHEDGLTFKSDAAYDDFIEVLVDGAVISIDNYTTRAGSIVVELNAVYLASLTEGEHTITVRSASGNATTQFTVEAKVLSPKTGSADGWAWEIAAVAALGILCVTVVVFVNRKRKTA